LEPGAVEDDYDEEEEDDVLFARCLPLKSLVAVSVPLFPPLLKLPL